MLSIVTYYKHNPLHERVWVEEFLESLDRQTSKEWELIWTGDVVDEVLGRPQVRLAADLTSDIEVRVRANRAVKEYARGEWVCAVGANDTFDSAYVERAMEAMKANPWADFWVTNTDPSTYSDEIMRNSVMCGVFVLRRSVWLELGGYTEREHCPSDWHLWMKLWTGGYKGVVTADDLFHWRRHADSGSDYAVSRPEFGAEVEWMRKNV